jgi:Lon protease-like protein
MVDELDTSDFSRVCRLFPLPHVVLFPHAILPLHIFEPRYRQMTTDALEDGDKLITIVLPRPGASAPGLGDPPIEDVACLGRILQHERLPDGRFNFLLLGLKRVRLVRELLSEKLYRLAEADLLEDQDDIAPGDPLRGQLVSLFRRVVQRGSLHDPSLGDLLDMELPLGILTDVVAHSMGLSPEIKQALLAETRVAHRAQTLLDLIVPSRRSAHEPRHFPPPFSDN